MDEQFSQIIALLITIASMIIAWWQNRQKNDIVQFYSEPTVTPSPVTAVVPKKSWTMSDMTKRWITASETEADKATILAQIAQNELLGNTEYTVNYSKGFYFISWGLIKSSGRDK